MNTKAKITTKNPIKHRYLGSSHPDYCRPEIVVSNHPIFQTSYIKNSIPRLKDRYHSHNIISFLRIMFPDMFSNFYVRFKKPCI